MLRNIGIRLLAILIACITYSHAQQLATPARAAPQAAAKSQSNSDPLEVKLQRHKVVVVDGKEALQSAAIAKPGEILEEVATYTNNSRSPLKSLEATLPIPANTELLLASVKPGNAKASIDGGQFFAMPLKRRVKQANGLEVELPIPASEYRYLRWYPGDLAAGKSLVFSARLKVSNDNTLAVTSTVK